MRSHLLHRGTLPRVAELILGLVVVAVCLGLVVGSTLAGIGLIVKDRADAFLALPTALKVTNIPQRSVMLDRTGRPIAYFWDQNRQQLATRQMAKVIRDAVVAVEDQRFYENNGIDLQGVARAFANDLAGGERQGGSTITQQYVKNLLVSHAGTRTDQKAATADTYDRKVAEARYALALNQRMSKDDILTGYLNLIYFGRGAYGVQAAAETYFRTSAAALTLPQAAMLAGMVQSPAHHDPLTHPAEALERRNVVLDLMLETGKITNRQAQLAKRSRLGVRPGGKQAGCYGNPAGYFCDWVLRSLLADPALGRTPKHRQLLLDTGGLVIRTTLDPGVQRSTEKAVARARGSRAALATVVQQPGTGHVLAMTASVPFGVKRGQSSVNLPLGGSSGFQAGSTFKIFVLTQAIASRVPLDLKLHAPQRYTSHQYARYNVVNGRPTPYVVGNAADSEEGVFTLEEATWHSVNTYFMQLQERVGFLGPAKIAESMGVRRADGGPLHRIPSFTLGTNEVSPMAMTGALATYAAHGRYCPSAGITTVQAGPKRLKIRKPAPCRQVLTRQVADTVTRVLAGVMTKGTGTNARVPGESAGKTGTVQDFSAAWFTGYTPKYAAAVWMGDPRGGFRHPLVNIKVGGQVYPHMYGGNVPARTWAALIAGSPGVGERFRLVPGPVSK